MDSLSVTIGITCYNAESTISDCVLSALNQTYPNLRIIIVDDCSSDLSYSLLQEFKSPLLTLLRNTSNLGASASRNRIIENSDSDLICFLDDDDTAHPERVALQVKALALSNIHSNPYVVCVPSMLRLYPSGYQKYLKALGTEGAPPHGLQLVDYLLFNKRVSGVDYGYCSPTCSFMTSRQLFHAAGLFDPSMKRVEDNDIVIRFCFLSTIFVGIDRVLVFQSATSSSDKTFRRNLLSELKLIRKNKEYLHNCCMYRYSRLSAFCRYFYFKRDFSAFLGFLFCLFSEKPFYAFRHYLRTSLRRSLHDFRIKNG